MEPLYGVGSFPIFCRFLPGNRLQRSKGKEPQSDADSPDDQRVPDTSNGPFSGDSRINRLSPHIATFHAPSPLLVISSRIGSRTDGRQLSSLG